MSKNIEVKQIFLPGKLFHIHQIFERYKDDLLNKGFRFKAEVLFFLPKETVNSLFEQIPQAKVYDDYHDIISKAKNSNIPEDLEFSSNNFYAVVQEKDNRLILNYDISFEVEKGKTYFFIGEFNKDSSFPLFQPRVTTDPVSLPDHVYDNTIKLMQKQIYKIK